MKKAMGILAAGLLTFLLTLVLILPGCAEEQGQETAEWTVLFYFCGSDLESEHSYASGNLAEITTCMSYKTRGGVMMPEDGSEGPAEDVNVVIETGGSKKWHAQELGMNIRTDVLQRWVFRPDGSLVENRMSSFELVEEVPLANMADPGTLTDFIRWGTANYPAKKYALVLWDHGTGAINGMIIDELYDGATMPLQDLKKALDDGGAHFEALIFDACLMANIENAYMIRDNANWMVASEEVVAGKGTAMGDWLQQLYCTPQWNGQRLGRWLCEMTQVKYAEEAAGQSEDTMTWSVIDLSKIDRLAAAFDRFFEYCGKIYVQHPDYMKYFSVVMNDAFEFGLGDADMIDLAQIPYHPYNILLLEESVYTELLDAVTEAVVYNIHGPNRAKAGGLSFCYATGLTPAQLDAYAMVCPSCNYLALMDAINPNWDAPDWVYEKAERLPEIVDMPEYQIKVRKEIGADGMPTLTVTDGVSNLWLMYVHIARLNERTGNTVYLGATLASYTGDEAGEKVSYSTEGYFPMWPAIEGVICTVQLVDTDFMEKLLYNIPIQIGDETYQLRCGIEARGKEPRIYGVWEGYNADSGVYGRNVIPLSKLAGQDFSLLYPIEKDSTGATRYESSVPMPMYRSLELSSAELMPGTYYVSYIAEDIFMRELPVGRAEVEWDGETLKVKEGTWEGETMLTMVN